MQEIYNVCEFGAVADGKSLHTRVIQKAIDACAEAGGGTVYFPSGTYKAGTLYLKSNVTLRLASGATLLQSKDMKDYVRAEENSYVHHTGSHYAFLHGKNVNRVSIVGEGTIDGNKENSVIGRGPRGPLSVIFENSQNILMKDVTVVNSPGWSVTFFGCKHVDVIKVKCLNSFADGINPACCQDVLYDGVLVDGSGDDAITIKNDSTGYSYETRPDCGYLSENIVIKNTTVRNTTHPAVKLGTGTYGIFRNILVSDCTFENIGAMFTIQLMRPKYEETPDRTIENVTFSNIRMKNVGRLLDLTSLDVTRPIIRNISIENIIVDGVREPSIVYGLPDAPIRRLTLSNVKLTGTPAPCWLKARYVRGLRLSNVQLQLAGAAKSALIYENGRDLELDSVSIKGIIGKGPIIKLNQVKGAFVHKSQMPAIETFLRAEGHETEDIRFAANDFRKVKIPFDAAGEVRKKTVSPVAEKVEYSNLSVSKEIKANEGFRVSATVANAGGSGAYKVEVLVDGEVADSKWLWLEKGERREITMSTVRYYKPGSYIIKMDPLTRTGVVKPTPAAFEFGEKMKINSPAQAGELTTVTVPVKNVGGREGTKEVKLYADGKVVTSKKVTLGPGEEREVTTEYRFKEAGPHKLKIADFPVWPFATFANTEANFYQTRKKIMIEAGGGRHDIRKRDREYAAVYLKDVKGDFVATARVLKQDVTGPYSGGGLMVKNDITKPRDSAGCVLAWHYPKYSVARFEHPMVFKIEKAANVLEGVWKVSPADSDTAQDVGIFANAFSAKNELCRVEFEYFKLEQR